MIFHRGCCYVGRNGVEHAITKNYEILYVVLLSWVLYRADYLQQVLARVIDCVACRLRAHISNLIMILVYKNLIYAHHIDVI